MNYDEAKAVRMRQIQGGEVEPDDLQRAMAILSQPPPPRVKKPKAPTEPKQVRVPLKQYPDISNPWSLNGAQCEMLRLRSDGLSVEQTAEAMGRSARMVFLMMDKVLAAMVAGSVIAACIYWDRHVRGDAA